VGVICFYWDKDGRNVYFHSAIGLCGLVQGLI